MVMMDGNGITPTWRVQASITRLTGEEQMCFRKGKLAGTNQPQICPRWELNEWQVSSGNESTVNGDS